MMNFLRGATTRKVFLPQHFYAAIVILIILLIVSILMSLAFGSRTITWNGLMDGIFHPSVDSYETSIVKERMARTVFSLLCGAALGVSGALMQAVTRNPIADPSILGVNTGASLAVVCGITFLSISSVNEYIWLAIAGAFVTAIFVFTIGSMGASGATPLKLVLAGAATSAILSSVVTAILIPRMNVMDKFRFWQVGSVGAGNWEMVKLLIPFLIVGIVIALLTAPALNTLALGDEVATGLGVNTAFIRGSAAFAGVLLCSVATALAGPIGFIGLLATHLVRLILGADIRFILPFTAFAGAIILTISDVFGRLIGSPGEVEVGIITAFIGAPILIAITMKAKMRTL